MYSLLLTKGRKLFYVALFLGVVSGIGYALIFPVVVHALQIQNSHNGSSQDGLIYIFLNASNEQIAILFILICSVAMLSKFAASSVTNFLAQKLSVNLRRRLFNQIVSAKIRDVESIGSSALSTCIFSDVINVVAGTIVTPTILASTITLVCILFYMAFIDFDALILVLAIMSVGLISYYMLIKASDRFHRKSQLHFDDVSSGAMDLILGVKELKLNASARKEHIENILAHHEEKASKEYLKGSSIVYAANIYGESLNFFAIGIMLFCFPYINQIDTQSQAGLVISLLFVMSPVSIILNAIPVLLRGNVSFRRIQDIMGRLSAEIKIEHNDGLSEFYSISLRNVNYSYHDLKDHKERFALRNISLTFNRGEINFIAGGNGSGKSTLGKVLSTHYRISSGAYLADDFPITDANVESFRRKLGAIFPDFHLFPYLAGYNESMNTEIKEYLHLLKLDKKISVNSSGKLSTINLSTGERKRVALFVALLANKDIYIFDEWAADQDPEFKVFFYQEFLYLLKKMGKIIIVITHDDLFFSFADKIIEMEYGAVKAIKKVAAQSAFVEF